MSCTRLLVSLALATLALPGCLGPCGVADEYARGTDGAWVVTRSFSYASPCPAFDAPEQLAITIDGDAITVDSPEIAIDPASVAVRTDGARQLVDFTVVERWLTDAAPLGYVSAPVTYHLELVPATARLEGVVASSFPYHTETAATTCESSGAASGGRVGP